MIRPEPSLPDSPDALPLVRDYLSKHPEHPAWDANDLACVLQLPEAEVESALEALAVEDEVLP